jgi:uncharacterized cupin superfamily protein
MRNPTERPFNTKENVMSSQIQKFDRSLAPDAGLTRRADYDPKLMASGDPRQWGHYYVERRDIGLLAGIWQNAVFESQPNRMSGHEFFVVAEGEVIIEEADGTRVTIARGECAVVPHGLEHRWIQRIPARMFYIKYITKEAIDPANAPTRVLRIDAAMNMPASVVPPRDLLLSEDAPITTEHTFFRTADGKMTVGMWTATPYRRRAISFPRFEMMHILAGATRFPEPDGTQNEVTAGETAIVPYGVVAEWWNTVPVKKVACNFFGAE